MSIYWTSCRETTHKTPEPDRGHPPKLWYPQGRPEFDDVLWGTSTLGQTLLWHTSSRSNANVHLGFHDSSHKLLGYGMIRHSYIYIYLYNIHIMHMQSCLMTCGRCRVQVQVLFSLDPLVLHLCSHVPTSRQQIYNVVTPLGIVMQ